MSVNLSLEEKAIYPLVGYGLVWWPLYAAGQHWLEPAVGSALAGFIWLVGMWFLPFAGLRKRFSLGAWLGLSFLYALAVFVLRLGLDRIFDAI